MIRKCCHQLMHDTVWEATGQTPSPKHPHLLTSKSQMTQEMTKDTGKLWENIWNSYLKGGHFTKLFYGNSRKIVAARPEYFLDFSESPHISRATREQKWKSNRQLQQKQVTKYSLGSQNTSGWNKAPKSLETCFLCTGNEQEEIMGNNSAADGPRTEQPPK